MKNKKKIKELEKDVINKVSGGYIACTSECRWTSWIPWIKQEKRKYFDSKEKAIQWDKEHGGNGRELEE